MFPSLMKVSLDFLPGGSGVRLNDGRDIKLFILVGWRRSFFVCCLAHRGSTFFFLFFFFLLQCSIGVIRHHRDLQVSVATHFSVESSSLFHHSIYP